jgi:hypothetical protein
MVTRRGQFVINSPVLTNPVLCLQDVCGNNFTAEAQYGTWGYALTQVPQDPYHELDDAAAAAGTGADFDGFQAVFEIAPLQASTLQGRASPSRAKLGASNSAAGGASQPSWVVCWCVVLLVLLGQLAM